MKSTETFPFAPHAIEGYRLRWLRRLRISTVSALAGFVLGYAVARWLA